jgi:outer membrane receptor for ferrienterochelin and colicins
MRYLLPAILLLGTQIASAQSILKDKDDKELSVLLNEVVITGTGTEHYLKDAPVQTEVITSKALEQYQARSIDDLLSGLSPSLTFHDGDMGSHIQLNGLNNDYILIMINGKRMNGDVGGQNDLNQLNPANIERIEIVKGAASSLYGSDAIAGVINIITKRNREKMELTNTSRIGEYGDIRQSTSFGFNYRKIKSVTGINFRHTDGWRNTDLQWDQNQLKSGSTMLTVNRSSNYTLSENIEWQVNRKLDLTAEGTYYERWVMRTHGPWKYQANDFYYRNYTFAVGSKYKLGKRNYLTADLSYGRYGYFYDYKLNEHTDYFLDNDRHERITYFAGFNLSGGYTHLNTQDVELEQPIDKSIKNAYNINAQWAHSWKIYRLNINLNGRFNSKRFSKSYGYAPEYQLWDLNTRHSFNLKSVIIEPGFGMENLFDYMDDRPYNSNYATLTPGRSFYISLSLKFKS